MPDPGVGSRLLRLVLQYEGTGFSGWQRQPNAPSVQGLLEEKLSFLLKETVTVTGAGRTDAGVHARRQCCHFQTASSFPDVKLIPALNAHLPPTVRVIVAAAAPAGFHARFDAVARTYRYHLCTTPVRSPFLERHAWRCPHRLDLAAMRAAAAKFAGEHDFAALGEVEAGQRTVRTVAESRLAVAAGVLVYQVTSRAFLRHQVRRMVGLLVEIGRGAAPLAVMDEVLAGAPHRAAKRSVPPEGLFLWKIEYPGLDADLTDGLDAADALFPPLPN